MISTEATTVRSPAGRRVRRNVHPSQPGSRVTVQPRSGLQRTCSPSLMIAAFPNCRVLSNTKAYSLPHGVVHMNERDERTRVLSVRVTERMHAEITKRVTENYTTTNA